MLMTLTPNLPCYCCCQKYRHWFDLWGSSFFTATPSLPTSMHYEFIEYGIWCEDTKWLLKNKMVSKKQCVHNHLPVKKSFPYQLWKCIVNKHQNKHPPMPTTFAAAVTTPHITHTTAPTHITGATPLVTPGPQLHPFHPKARAKNKLRMSQRVFQSTQCIPLVPGATGRNYWLILTGSGSPLRITQEGKEGWGERQGTSKRDKTLGDTEGKINRETDRNRDMQIKRQRGTANRQMGMLSGIESERKEVEKRRKEEYLEELAALQPWTLHLLL